MIYSEIYDIVYRTALEQMRGVFLRFLSSKSNKQVNPTKAYSKSCKTLGKLRWGTAHKSHI